MACNAPQDEKNTTVTAPEKTADTLTIEIIAQKSFWTVRYPGKDGVLGRHLAVHKTVSNPYALDSIDTHGADDIVRTDSLDLPLNVPVHLQFRSLDIVHGAYFPHFRLSVNMAPGQVRTVTYTAAKSTDEMRREIKNPAFYYMLACNKICGEAHYKMQLPVNVKEK